MFAVVGLVESAFDSLGFYVDVDDFFDFSVQYFCAVFVDVDLLESAALFLACSSSIRLPAASSADSCWGILLI